MFKVRNANQSPMEPGEIFKAEVVFEDETALKILKLLKEMLLLLVTMRQMGSI